MFRPFHHMILLNLTHILRSFDQTMEGNTLRLLIEFMNSKGILHQTTCPYSPPKMGWLREKIKIY